MVVIFVDFQHTRFEALQERSRVGYEGLCAIQRAFKPLSATLKDWV